MDLIPVSLVTVFLVLSYLPLVNRQQASLETLGDKTTLLEMPSLIQCPSSNAASKWPGLPISQLWGTPQRIRCGGLFPASLPHSVAKCWLNLSGRKDQEVLLRASWTLFFY